MIKYEEKNKNYEQKITDLFPYKFKHELKELKENAADGEKLLFLNLRAEIKENAMRADGEENFSLFVYLKIH